jgi:hypothetical protein
MDGLPEFADWLKPVSGRTWQGFALACKTGRGMYEDGP